MQHSVYIRHLESGKEYGNNENAIMEGSSTIKVAISLLTLHKLKADKISLLTKLPILPQHLSIGSGKLNWMRKRSLTILGHIYYIARYSDCVATNVLIDFLGGQEAINQQLTDLGLMTRLEMASLQFTDQETAMPHVSTTTARELAGLFEQLLSINDNHIHRWLMRQCFSRIDQPWYDGYLNFKEFGSHKLWTKTGSMTEVGPKRDTVMNVVGIVKLRSGTYLFSTLNRVSLTDNSGIHDLDQVTQQVVNEFMKEFTLFIH